MSSRSTEADQAVIHRPFAQPGSGGGRSAVEAVIRASFERLQDGRRDGLDELYTPSARNHEAEGEPPATRVAGPDGFHATSVWLRGAFSDLRIDLEELVVDGDVAVARTTMHGRHTGDFPTWERDGSITAFPPTGKTFAQAQVHWFAMQDGRIDAHRAQRDDLGMAKELGWVPPTPAYLVRMALAGRRVRRDHDDVAKD